MADWLRILVRVAKSDGFAGATRQIASHHPSVDLSLYTVKAARERTRGGGQADDLRQKRYTEYGVAKPEKEPLTRIHWV